MKAVDTLSAVDASCVIATIQASTATLVTAMNVETCISRINILIIDTFVRVTMTVAGCKPDSDCYHDIQFTYVHIQTRDLQPIAPTFFV